MLRLVAAGLAAAALGSGPDPALVVTSFRADLDGPQGAEAIAWQAPERYASPGLVMRDGSVFYAAEPGYPGSIVRRTYAARPDAYLFADLLAERGEFLLAQARAGKPALRETILAGRPAWRGKLPLAPNDCAGLARGSAEVWLERETLLPLRLVEQRGGERSAWNYSYGDLNQPLPAGTFARPRQGANPYTRDEGFRRTSPEEAARHLSYTPMLPAYVPEGFALAVSGWAPRSSFTGAEGQNPRYRELFAAVYRRGLERIDVTQRLAGETGWIGDPFAGECVFQFSERASVAGVRAGYGAGPDTTPHLYWRRGRVLLSVSGPFPKAELVRIAESLAPVAGS